MNENRPPGWRTRKTPSSVRRAERTAKVLIMLGGAGTILAVILIFVFLVSVAVPLFGSGEVEKRNEAAVKAVVAPPVAMGTDEYRLVTWTLSRDGKLKTVRSDNGSILAETEVVSSPTAIAVTPAGTRVVFGFADGSVRTGSIGFSATFLEPHQAPAAVRDLLPGEVGEHEGSLYQVTPEGQLRATRIAARVAEPVRPAQSPIRRIDFAETPSGPAYGALSEDGHLAVYSERVRHNMLTGEDLRDVDEVRLPYEPPQGRGLPDHLTLSGVGNLLYLIWEDGYAIRYDARDAESARAAETFHLVEGDLRVTHVRNLIGKTTLLVGDTGGGLSVWFPAKPDDAGTVDGTITFGARVLEGPRAPVTAIAPSARSRLVAAGYGDGTVRVFQTTSGKLVAEAAGDASDPVHALTLAPKEDGLVALGPKSVRSWDMDPGHPEASLGTLFGKVWYEAASQPEWVWQSTGGTDDFEPKLSLIPLVFGTLKATLYAMLIAIPIAILGALFTTEFLRPQLRAPIKSVIEMMASLPSVVLGFMAALIVAPFVQKVLPATLAAFLGVPFCLLLGSRVWQLLPHDRTLRWSGAPRLAFLSLALPAGIGLAVLLGPALEGVFFAGNLMEWLDGRAGGALGGWAFVLLPLGTAAVAVGIARRAGPWIRATTRGWSRKQCALFDLGRFGATVLGGALVALLLGLLLTQLGADPRASVVGTYTQRNALIVGFVMGFAIVPIIYTLAEDALSSVPVALREGSLGAGATPWQTATRIVVPTAMSGLFGAMMVGLGRAVGETMIVLMATGNTPILKWNVFEGLRALPANIAVELPEAVRNSTHYRTLFLSALVLFAMTFVINTLAEMVRRRFRKAYAEQL